MTSRRLILALPWAGLVILGLVVYKSTRPVRGQPAAEAAVLRRAPLFELYDQQMQRVPLARYLGRHKLLVVFFDGSRPGSSLLGELRRNAAAIERTGAVLLAVGTAPPAAHRELFPGGRRVSLAVLSDILDQGVGAVHRQWGAFDEAASKPKEAVFVVDRAGIIRYEHLAPGDLGTAATWIQELHAAP